MSKSKKVVAVIPARMGSSRFPGKPLAPILGIPMIEHVRKRVAMCKSLDGVYVATCDKESFDTAKRFKRIGLPDLFPDEYGSQASLMEKYSITLDNVASVVTSLASR